ncbi:MAG: alpha-glucan family phosphorylase [Bdellovibrionota bacterium]
MIPLRERLAELAGNLRWTWNGEFDHLFRDIDVDLWRKVNHSPTAFLAEVDPRKIEAQRADPRYCMRLERACHSLRDYLASDRHWALWSAPGLAARPVAYFSAEFGLHESLPIYSGGLGVLAGDHLKSSSDLGVPIWGVSLLYREGYFYQHISADGSQEEVYTDLDLRRVPVEPLLDGHGNHRKIEILVNSGSIPIFLWHTRIGRARLLLLDCCEGLDGTHRNTLTRRLYGGDQRNRLLQEVVLGVGGYQALRALGVHPGVLHLNEGHCAFAALEAAAQIKEERGLSFEEAVQIVRGRTLFTTHTPVVAGHDRFSSDLVEEHLEPLRRRLGLAVPQLLGLGRVNPQDESESFCMTVLAVKLANQTNAVSSLHAHTSRTMWQSLWPDRNVHQVPIGHVTNGVHVPSWIALDMAELFRRSLGEDWLLKLCRPELWDKIHQCDPFELWDLKCLLKQKNLTFVERRLHQREERLNVPLTPPLNPAALTIGFARRFVEYKRADLIFHDLDRLARLLGDSDKPIQILFSGKAHPNDHHGKAILRRIYQFTQEPRFKGKIFLIENHDMNMSRHLLQGCDLWLNTPRKPLEACGTSGQKAIFNATLNLSTLDGWWAEAYDGKNGYAFGGGQTHADPAVQDERDAASLYEVLEGEVIPEFFERSAGGIPAKWVGRIQRALATLAWRYNSDRMVMDYVTGCYLPASGSLTSFFPPSP